MSEHPNDRRVWFITGTSSGLGAALALAVHAAGDIVVCAQRDPTHPPLDLTPADGLSVKCDMTKPETLDDAIRQTVAAFGRVDVLVNNAGVADHGAVEELTEQEFRDVLEVNLFGPLRLIKAVLPAMRERGAGRIVNVSSIAGFSGLGGSASYSASKFGLEGLSEALAKEVSGFGVRIVIVEPGGFRTDFRKRNLRFIARRIGAYAETVGKQAEKAKAGAAIEPGDPAKAAAAIIAAVDAPEPPMRLLLGNDAWRIAQGKLKAIQADFNTWRETTQGTDCDDVTPAELANEPPAGRP